MWIIDLQMGEKHISAWKIGWFWSVLDGYTIKSMCFFIGFLGHGKYLLTSFLGELIGGKYAYQLQYLECSPGPSIQWYMVDFRISLISSSRYVC